MKNRLYRWTLSLLGFSTVACSLDLNIEDPVMYGVPSVKLTIKGQVTDAETGKAIPGIQVSLDHAFDDSDTRTNNQGEFILTSRIDRWDANGVVYRFSDVDGAQNGAYTDRELPLVFSEANQTEKGDGSWYNGAFERDDIEVALRKVASTDTAEETPRKKNS